MASLMSKDVVICGYVRSPFTPAKKGDLARIRPDDLAAEVVKGLIKKYSIKVDDVEDLILGCAFPEAEQGMNLARNVVFLSGLPNSVGGVTVNRFCASSMQAIHQAAGAIMSGSGELFIAGGVESMSRVPMAGFNPMLNPSLVDMDAYIGMGHTAENLAIKHLISREEQEKMALSSHQKAAAAQDGNFFENEIIPVNGIVVDGAGFLLNNEMDDFSAKPGVPNAFGLIGNEANSIAPGKRPLSSMTPTIVLKERKPFLIIGSPGGSTIITTAMQTILNVIVHKMDIKEAVCASIFHSQWLQDVIEIEHRGLSNDVLINVKSKGHIIVYRGG